MKSRNRLTLADRLTLFAPTPVPGILNTLRGQVLSRSSFYRVFQNALLIT